MKNKKLFLVGILSLSVLLMAGCSKSKSKNVNELGGTGKLKNAKTFAEYGKMYDDENIYFTTYSRVQISDVYMKITKDDKVFINCSSATCNHNTSECSATVINRFNEFNGKLYKYRDNVIKDEDDKNVYKNNIPEEVTDDDASDEIEKFMALSDEYAIISCNRYMYLIDSKFNIIYTIIDEGRDSWGKVYNEKYYYVNELEELTEVDIKNGTSKIIEFTDRILTVADGEEYIFFFDSKHKFHRYSLEKNEDVILKDYVAGIFFMVFDGYVYYEDSEWSGCHKEIWDYDGNIVRDCTDCNRMSMMEGFKVNDRIYSIITDDDGRQGIAVMKEDGTDYKEIYIEN